LAVIPHELKLVRDQNRAAARAPEAPRVALSGLLARLRPPDRTQE